MRQFKVTEVFRDKITKQMYAVGDTFSSDDDDRIADVQSRGLIGEELEPSQTQTQESEKPKKARKAAKEDADDQGTTVAD